MMKATVTSKNIPPSQYNGSVGINKKVVLAIAMVLVLMFMWGRLLFSDDSNVKEAKGNMIQMIAPLPGSEYRPHLKRVKLPVVAGRNDVITHDMFSTAGWASLKSRTITVGSQSIAGMDAETQEMRVRQIAGTLELGAIINGVKDETNKAFVDGKLVSAGSKLRVRRSGRVYVFNIEDVMRDRVVLKWKEFTMTIKMTETSDLSGN